MPLSMITQPQLTRLQILYGQFERHSLDCPGADRSYRLTWATQQAGRPVTSFKQLTVDEGIRLIDLLQRHLGTRVPSKVPRRRPTRRDAQKLGTEGRRDQIHNETTLAGPSEIALLKGDMDRLGWDEARLEAFLRSPRSPLKGVTRLTTLGHYNKLHWALRNFKLNAS